MAGFAGQTKVKDSSTTVIEKKKKSAEDFWDIELYCFYTNSKCGMMYHAEIWLI